MALHLIKLCVGCDTVDDLAEWIDERRQAALALGQPPRHTHVTRMVPRQRDALLAGGSLYWVIKGWIQVRQVLRDVRSFVGADGIGRCELELDPELILTDWQPRRPFQGWRYLEAKDAPKDLPAGAAADLPPALRAELAELGLL